MYNIIKDQSLSNIILQERWKREEEWRAMQDQRDEEWKAWQEAEMSSSNCEGGPAANFSPEAAGFVSFKHRVLESHLLSEVHLSQRKM